MASELHMSDVPEATCEDGEVWENEILPPSSAIEQPTDVDHQRAHNHHRHSCGSCHVHIVSHMDAEHYLAPISAPNFLFGPNYAAPRKGLQGLFRPPRD
ncbi:hypothetical protein GCM10007853_17540 [Algimonas ampicilliniresistens]|uniref:Uncharacterized protein n=2 Tax=Algimonas ampicilliniresistens TaxID=1298735 RepID=A0ABQ5V8Y4_9PROT|nr:hypothetical protein GCM10007853_17540 [Algimonas ampicilliniresistens]